MSSTYKPLQRADPSFRGALPGLHVCVCVCVIEGDQVQQYPPIPIKNREIGVRIKETERLLRGKYESACKVSHEDDIA